MATELSTAQEQLRILEAVACALGEPHGVLDLILDAEDPDTANDALQERFGLDQVQAAAIVDMQLRRLTNRDRARIHGALHEARDRVKSLGG